MLLGRPNMLDANEEEKSGIPPSELLIRLQYLEDRLPKLEEPSSNEVPMKQLPSSATLADVISAVNELIKRDLTVSKVQ